MNTLKSILLAVAVTISATAAKKPVPVKVDAAKSTVNWLGKKVTGEHSGVINIKEGNLLIDAGKLTGGSFTIDMNSITCTDIKDEGYAKKLVGHLKDDDFFGVEKNPTAKLVVTKVSPKATAGEYDVTGDFTIKGKTQSVTFPVAVKTTGKAATATAKITLDRTKFDIRYGSKSFFDNLGDKTINDEFELNITLVAGK